MASTTSIARNGAWKLLAIIAVVAVLGVTMVLGVRPIAGFFKNRFPANNGSVASVSAVGGKPAAPRDRLGINVAGVTYYGGEPIYANQLFGLRWLVPSAGWGGIDNGRLRPDGFPKGVDGSAAAPGVVSILNPPADAQTSATAVTRCTWQGKGIVGAGGMQSDLRVGNHSLQFRWGKAIGSANRVWISIDRSDAANPIRAMDCRQVGLANNAQFAPSLLAYLKPFGVLRFLDMSAANSNPASVTWATRSLPGDLVQRGSDSTSIENMVALANANGSSPWFTVPWNADADYHRRMAQLVHDSIPAGKPVYVEISNEVWNYSFGQAGQAEREGQERKLSDTRFQANVYRYAQKITEVMPIWAEVFEDRPKDLVRVAATQADNAWVGANIFEWNKGAAAGQIDAIAIAPYFKVDTDHLTGDHDANMVALAAEAKRQIAVKSAEYKALADKWDKRLIAYEGGQHQIDPDNQKRLAVMNRDPRMEAIYRQYLTDWNVLTGDVFTLYSATGPISRYGAWGLREYAGQPLSATPKLRGVLDYAEKH
ncbi:hypothetical protein ASG67_10780 [Sphingomonas sp. Leaf339]|uniref:hypothetical protein n=1 Tax=Sphingomonas sp. Leaf339 TaxID=1736343 RepID=UPI0006F6709D|nr:hypothetical protein [Sphingomonas sp. Leaf339]KQU49610.1 hypothetical protein ASG67_10780 [Sphingomonas sp. Leaf339]